MITTLRNAVTGAALAAAFVLPVAAPAATVTGGSPVQLTMQTRITERYGAGEYDGTLRLTLNPDGIVQGTYQPLDGNIRAVTGGVDGKNIWLDIGMVRPLHLTGTYEHGVLRAVAATAGPDTYTLESTSVKQTG